MILKVDPPQLVLLLAVLLASVSRVNSAANANNKITVHDDAELHVKFDNVTFFVLPHPVCTEMILRKELNVSFRLSEKLKKNDKYRRNFSNNGLHEKLLIHTRFMG